MVAGCCCVFESNESNIFWAGGEVHARWYHTTKKRWLAALSQCQRNNSTQETRTYYEVKNYKLLLFSTLKEFIRFIDEGIDMT